MIYIEALEHLHEKSNTRQNGHRSRYLELSQGKDYLLLDQLEQLVRVQKVMCQQLNIDTHLKKYQSHSYEYPRFRVIRRPVKGRWQPVLKSIDDAWSDFDLKRAQFIKRKAITNINKKIKDRTMWSEGIMEMLNCVTQDIVQVWQETDPEEARHFENGYLIAMNILTNLTPARSEQAPRRINIPGIHQVAYDHINNPVEYEQWVQNIKQVPYFIHIY